jgi:hypothetical protein
MTALGMAAEVGASLQIAATERKREAMAAEVGAPLQIAATEMTGEAMAPMQRLCNVIKSRLH